MSERKLCKPIHDSVKVTLYIPRHVDRVWRAVGYDAIDYQLYFLDVIRSMFDAVMCETPAAQGAILMLQQEVKQLGEMHP